MLVTSSQISVAISSGVVFIFTSLLFLSGYVLQQQTIRSLQASIHPALTQVPEPPSTNPVLAKHFGRPPGHSFYDKYLASNRPKGGWAKVAYVQLVREYAEVCNSVMLFSELEAQESMAQRVLLYPQEWDDRGEDDIDPSEKRARETSKRLMRSAAKDYKVMIQPIAPVPAASSAQGDSENGSGGSSWDPEERFPLSNLLALFTFNRILYLPPSGLLIDVTPMDLLFTLPMEDTPLLGLSDPQQKEKQTSNDDSRTETDPSADILLFEPSKPLYKDALSSLPEGAYSDAEFLAQLVHITSAPMATDDNPTTLLTRTESLGQIRQAQRHDSDEEGSRPRQSFNETAFWDNTAYIRLMDQDIPGPEYDFSRSKAAVRVLSFEGEDGGADGVGDGEARRSVWVGVYERFTEERMDVCGLDLEPFF